MKVLILFCLFHSSFGLKASQGCYGDQPSEPVPGKHQTFFFTYYDKGLGAVERNYFIQIPKGISELTNQAFHKKDSIIFPQDYRHDDPSPLVLDLHGYQGNAENQMSKMKLRNKVDFIFIYNTYINTFQIIPLGRMLD